MDLLPTRTANLRVSQTPRPKDTASQPGFRIHPISTDTSTTADDCEDTKDDIISLNLSPGSSAQWINSLRNGVLRNCVFGNVSGLTTMNATAEMQWRSPVSSPPTRLPRERSRLSPC